MLLGKYTGQIFTVEGIVPLKEENKVNISLIVGDLAYQCYKQTNAKKHKYLVRVGNVIEVHSNGMYMVSFPMAYRNKPFEDIYTFFPTEIGNTPQMAVKNNWLIV
jgi:hypothetical protein